MRTLLYKLAHRLIGSAASPSYAFSERFHLHLSILKELQLYDEAHKLLETTMGQKICAVSLACDEIRREIWRLEGLTLEEGDRAAQRIRDDEYAPLPIDVRNQVSVLNTITQ
jgi:N-terminal acetyltransferase B complex non-catalytic subunit